MSEKEGPKKLVVVHSDGTRRDFGDWLSDTPPEDGLTTQVHAPPPAPAELDLTFAGRIRILGSVLRERLGL